MSEPIRLHGKERHDWERAVIARHTRSRQHVLREILYHCAGKADCWPSNETLASSIGIKPRALQLNLRALEASGAILCVADDSLAVQRRIVVLLHPGALDAIRRGGATKCAPGAGRDTKERRKRSAKAAFDAQSAAPEVLNEENSKEKPDAGSAGSGPAGDQADWLAAMSPALRARMRGLLDGEA